MIVLAHGTTEFSDSDIDKSPSRNRRSSRQKVAAVNTSYHLDETSEPHSITRSPNSSLNRSRRSFGANTSYNLDETVFDPPETYSRHDRTTDRGSFSRFELKTPKEIDNDLSFETSNVLPEVASTGRISVRERRMQSGRASRGDSEHSRSILATSGKSKISLNGLCGRKCSNMFLVLVQFPCCSSCICLRNCS